MMEHTLLICIDDTDSLDSPGTGQVLEELLARLAEEGLGLGSFITRHQLLIHPDIPYTSHNSSMCSRVTTEDPAAVTEFCRNWLNGACAPGSDPGLCITEPAALPDREKLLAFGRAAKERVLTKEDAWAMARSAPEAIALSEHGGTGQGIIGALAGCGLRLSGMDGRCRGKLQPLTPGECLTPAQLCARGGVDAVWDTAGNPLPDQVQLVFLRPCKPIFRKNLRVAVARPRADGRWDLLSKQELPEELLV